MLASFGSSVAGGHTSYFQDGRGEHNVPISTVPDGERSPRSASVGMAEGAHVTTALEKDVYRTVKEEEGSLKDSDSVAEAQRTLKASFLFYNQERLHQALGYQTPAAVSLGS